MLFHQTITKNENKPLAGKKRNYSQTNKSFSYNMIKGRIAETLVEQLFLELGFQVFKYGMENTIPGIMTLLKGVRDDVALDIRKMPDFVVYRDNHAHFIEVKFRASETFTIKDLEAKGDYPYHNALILVVSKRHIKCISYEELKAGKEITPTCHNYLGTRKEFETDREKVIEYCKYAVKFFSHI